MTRRIASAVSGAALSAMLCACTPPPQLRAAWYLAGDTDAAASNVNRQDVAVKPDEMAVTVLNVGKAATEIYEVMLNSRKGEPLWRKPGGGARTLKGGEMLVIPFRHPARGAACDPDPVIIPVRVFVRTKEGQRSPWQVDILNPVPTTLADGWWPAATARCSQR